MKYKLLLLNGTSQQIAELDNLTLLKRKASYLKRKLCGELVILKDDEILFRINTNKGRRTKQANS